MKTVTGELIPAPTKAMQTLIGRANAEYKKVMDGRRATEVAKTYTLKHAILCGKALGKVKAKVGHGGWEALFESSNPRFSDAKNRGFEGGKTQALTLMKIARYPQQAAAAVLADSGERFNLDRTYAALSDATAEGEKASKTIALLHTGDEESYTPAEYIESARLVMGGIDLDPASNAMAQEVVQAAEYFDIDADGLSRPWQGRVWLNPPFTARIIDKFLDKTLIHYAEGDIAAAVVLTNNNTDTRWFHAMADAASAVCFTAGRINFLKRDGSESSPTNGQCFFYLGSELESFAAEFSKHGRVMVDWR